MALCGIPVNIVTGYLMGKVRGQTLIVVGLCGTAVSAILFHDTLCLMRITRLRL